MKPFINNKTTTLECENSGKYQFSLPSSLSVSQFSSHVTKRSSNLITMIARALKELRAGLDALSLTKETNKRIYWGVGLMGVAAPMAAIVYMVFDRTEYVEGWYHVNNFHLFHVICPWLFIVFSQLGTFLLFRQGDKRAYLVAVPLGFVFAKIIFLIRSTSNEEFWQLPYWQMVLSCIVVSLLILAVMDWLTWRHFHGKDALTRRFGTVYNAIGILPDAQVLSMFKENYENYKSFEAKH